MSLLNNSAPEDQPAPKRQPLFCYVTDRLAWPALAEPARREKLLHTIAALSAAGIAWIQLREKDLSARACAGLARDALRRIRAASSSGTAARLIVNDRLDVALAESAGGVHLGEQSLPCAEARRLLRANPGAPSDFLVGVSCHSLEAAQAAAAAGASYIFFGPVFATPSKAPFGPPQGLARLREVCATVPIPVLAIGGITLANAPSCLSAGASGIAAIRLFQNSPDPAALLRALLSPQAN